MTASPDTVDQVTLILKMLGIGTPSLFAGAMRSWPAMSLWGEAYLTRVAGGTEVTVDVTPNGRGDAVTRVGGWPCVAVCSLPPTLDPRPRVEHQ